MELPFGADDPVRGDVVGIETGDEGRDALAVEVASVDLKLEQEELRFLEMIRDALNLDGLIASAIEASARARLRKGKG